MTTHPASPRLGARPRARKHASRTLDTPALELALGPLRRPRGRPRAPLVELVVGAAVWRGRVGFEGRQRIMRAVGVRDGDECAVVATVVLGPVERCSIAHDLVASLLGAAGVAPVERVVRARAVRS